MVDVYYYVPYIPLCTQRTAPKHSLKTALSEKKLPKCIFFTSLTFSSGLLLYKNSNKQNTPQKGFIENTWRKKWLFNLPQFASFPFSFQMGKARSWEKWLLGPRHSQRPQRLPGGLLVSLAPTLELSSSTLNFQAVTGS